MTIENDNLENDPWLYGLKIKFSAEYKFVLKIPYLFFSVLIHAVLCVITVNPCLVRKPLYIL